jgi:hypothetical protein
MDFLKTQPVDDGPTLFHVSGRRCRREDYEERWSQALRAGGRPSCFQTLEGRTRRGRKVWRHYAQIC